MVLYKVEDLVGCPLGLGGMLLALQRAKASGDIQTCTAVPPQQVSTRPRGTFSAWYKSRPKK